MTSNASVRFFDEQFRRQLQAGEHALNPFERAALPYLHGKVLDYGCGLGNLALEAARRGCEVVALDASATAIDHLRRVAAQEALALRAGQADLQGHVLDEDFDAVVCIGLLMFFDCPTARRQLDQLLAQVRPGGIAIVNVLVEGTTFMDMFAPEGHCLFRDAELRERLATWQLLDFQSQTFDAPRGTCKAFATVIARKPAGAVASA